MEKQCVITEKPSVARDIAKVLGVNNKGEGNLYNDQYVITWAFGHLVELASPKEYGYADFDSSILPMLPESFKLVAKEDAKEQLRNIKKCFEESDKIIVATDAGREGELIFRYIYYYLGCTKPFERLWLSSMTDRAIRAAFQQLKDGKEYDNLYLAGKVRSEADWLVGLNASRALMMSARRSGFSLGRVQTPTLSMISKRYLENRNFSKMPFWRLQAQIEYRGINFTAGYGNTFDNKTIAESKLYHLTENIKAKYAGLGIGSIHVLEAEKSVNNTQSPLLYDLTTLQKEANIKYGLTADKTLSIVQSLYEKKATTYPRTGSRYIPEDVFETVTYLIQGIPYDEYRYYIQTLLHSNLNKSSVDDGKITDHHAIIITGEKVELEGDEAKIYKMICTRMLESFSGSSQKDILKLTFKSGEFELKSTISCVTDKGWKKVCELLKEPDKPNEGSNENNGEDVELETLPLLKAGDTVTVRELILKEGETKPKAIYTEATLLTAMEKAGKDIEDKEIRHAIQDVGLGTPATRAEVIETLIRRGYIVREKKKVLPTEKGLAVYEIVKDKSIGNAEMTGEWEKVLGDIEQGKLSVNQFKQKIEEYARTITSELLNVKIDMANDMACPKCGRHSVRIYPKVMKCNDESCGFIVFRAVAGGRLSEADCKQLIEKRKTTLLKSLKSKKGSVFDAYMILGDDFKTSFEFPTKKK